MTAIRRGAAFLHLLLTGLVLAGVVVEVALGGFVVSGALDADAHEIAGFVLLLVTVAAFLAALAAWLPARDLGLTFALVAVAFAAVLLPNAANDWLEGLHVVVALVLFWLALTLFGRARYGRIGDGQAR